MAEDLESAAIEIKLRCTKITMQRKTQFFLLPSKMIQFFYFRSRNCQSLQFSPPSCHFIFAKIAFLQEINSSSSIDVDVALTQGSIEIDFTKEDFRGTKMI